MGLTNLSLLTAPSISVTGGTAQTFAPDGTPVIRGIQVADVAIDSVVERHVVVCKNTTGSLQNDGSWSKDRRSVKYAIPEVLSDGSVDFAYIEVSLVKSPLRGATTVATLKEKGVQLIHDADFVSFWTMGALT